MCSQGAVMKYIASLFVCIATAIATANTNYTQRTTFSSDSERICKQASASLTWSPAPYTKVTADGKKILYYLQKPDKHVLLVADHGFVSFPITSSGKYRYFETYLVDEPNKSPRWMQREISFDRWNKLKDCKCDLNCPCWRGLDCTCKCCKEL